jgi:hypothetical protein
VIASYLARPEAWRQALKLLASHRTPEDRDQPAIAGRPGGITPIRRRLLTLGHASRAHRLQRCYERREEVIDAFFDLADAIIAVRSLIRQALGHLPVGYRIASSVK